MSVSDIAEKIDNITSELAPYRSFIEREISDIESIAYGLRSDMDRATQEGRKLRIGVVGQVKSGKSSFLNSLIFGGTGILPKAATPMTAALTVIEHAPEVKATVEFYTKDDWKTIEKAGEEHDRQAREIAKRFQSGGNGLPFGKKKKSPVSKEQIQAAIDREIPDDLKASKELVEMARRSGVDLKASLGQKKELKNLSSLKGLMDELQNYVGANGRFTPIVRNTVISSNVPEMEGIEIVDTPGINDPVISRGRLTKKRIGECDVVFVLSQCSQFVDSVDLELLVQNLPSRGIRKIILVGSQVDATLIGEKHKYPSLPQLMKGVVTGLEKRVDDLLVQLLSKSTDKEEQEVLRALKASPPLFVSSMAYAMSVHFDHMNEEEAHFLRLYNGLYPEKYSFDRDLLEDFSNIARAKVVLKDISDEKESILADRLKDINKGASNALAKRLEETLHNVERTIGRLESNDMDALERRSRDISTRLKNGRGHIENVFDIAIANVEKKLELLKSNVQNKSSDYRGVQVYEESYTTSYEVSTSKWWNPFSWGSSETRYRTITNRYADIHDAVDPVERFAYETENNIKKEIVDLIDLPKLRQDVKEGTIKLFDLGDMSFDPDDVLIPVNRMVSSISVPSIDFGDRDYSQRISSRFGGGRVEGSSIDSLKDAQREALADVLEDMKNAVDSKSREISSMLKSSRDGFLKGLLNDIEGELEETKKALQEKGKSLKALESIATIVKKYR